MGVLIPASYKYVTKRLVLSLTRVQGVMGTLQLILPRFSNLEISATGLRDGIGHERRKYLYMEHSPIKPAHIW